MRDELQTARRNFPRAEYQLVKDSFPETLHHLSEARLNAHIARCERLIASYKVRLKDKESLAHVWRGSAKISSGRLIRYRMNHLGISLKKFKAELRKSASATSARKPKDSGSSAKSKRAGTSKMSSAHGGNRRISATRASTKTKRQPKYPDLPESGTEEVSHTLTLQPKMRLARRGGKTSSTQFREAQRRESGPSNQVNPSSRTR